MKYKTLQITEASQVLTVSLNRPELRNAFNSQLIIDLTDVFSKTAKNKHVRLVVLEGNGKAFSAGGDLNWMKASIQYTPEENIRDAKTLGAMLQTINTLPQPVIGKVHGAALGGGMGLVSVCDHVVATADTLFGFSEVQLGLIPAVIGPFVSQKIATTYLRSLFLSGERFKANKALQIGLIHEIVDDQAALSEHMEKLTKAFLSCSPNAQHAAKLLIENLKQGSMETKMDIAAKALADIRVTDQAQEGIQAFLEKRAPKW